MGDNAREDLGLDDEVSTQVSKRMQQRQARRDSAIPTSIVQIDIQGQSFSVLSGRNREPVFMEATSRNLSTLHDLVSTESERQGLEAASAFEPGLEAEEDSDASDGHSADGGTPVEQVRGLTWVPKRRAWILRYEDDMGKKRQKRFGAKECTRAGQAAALRWLLDYKEARSGSR